MTRGIVLIATTAKNVSFAVTVWTVLSVMVRIFLRIAPGVLIASIATTVSDVMIVLDVRI